MKPLTSNPNNLAFGMNDCQSLSIVVGEQSWVGTQERGQAGQRQSMAVGGTSIRSKAAAVTHNPDSQLVLDRGARLGLG